MTAMRVEYESLNDLLEDRGLIDDEGTRVELKRAKGGLPGGFWTSVNAFLNTIGGHILLGCEDGTGKAIPAIEVDDLQRNISSGVSQRLDPAIAPELEVLKIDGHKVILVTVRPADIHQKPVYHKEKGGEQKAFKRVGASNLQMTKEDLERLAIDKSGKSPDSLPMRHFGLEHLDKGVLQRYRNRLRGFPSAQKLLERDDMGLLRGLNALHFDPMTNTWHLTSAALLLFGDSDIIMANFPSLEVQILSFDSSPTAENRGKKDPIIGMALIDFVGEVEKNLQSLVPYGNIRVTPGRIARDADQVYIALREALVNAIVHQDFLANRYIQIRIYGDKLEIENAGYSKKPTVDFKEPGSIPRNPIIARAFEMAGFVEKQGLGGTTMMNAMSAAGFADPKFYSNHERNSFTVSFFWHHFMSEDDLSWVSHLKDIKKKEEKIALVAARQQGSINNETLREKLACDTLAASRVLRTLSRKGYLQKSGSNKDASYRLTTKAESLKAGLAAKADSATSIPAGNSVVPITPQAPSSSQKAPAPADFLGGNAPLYAFDFEQTPKEAIGIYSQPVSKSAGQPIGIYSSNTSDIDSEVSNIFPVPSQASIALQLLKFVEVDFQPLSAIAIHIGMGEDNVRKTYLDRLIKAGLVVKKLSGQRPRGQAYKAATAIEPKPL